MPRRHPLVAFAYDQRSTRRTARRADDGYESRRRCSGCGGRHRRRTRKGARAQMKEILRNLMRRKMRSTLTISGIVIGIFALTTMGALAEHFNALLDVGVQYAGTAISVKAPAEQTGGLLALAKRDEIARVPGVAAVYPGYQVSAEPSGAAINLGAPAMITNEQRGASAYGMLETRFAAGHDLTENG